MAGRSVGNIEVTVDANTRHLKAQLTKAGKEGGEAAAAEIEEALDDIDAELGVEFKEGALRRAQEQAEEALDDLMAEVGIALDRTDLARVNAELEETFDDVRAEVTVAVDDGSLLLANARVEEAFDDVKAEVKVDVDEGAASAAGGRAGNAAGSSFIDSFSGRTQLLGAAIALAVEPGFVAIQGALAALTSVASSAFAGLAGGIGAAAPLLAGVAGGVATLAVGLQGMGDAVGAVGEEFAAAAVEGRAFRMNAEGITEALAGMAPPARDFVGAIAELMPQFDAIKRSVQGRLFAGLDDELRGLATTAIPSVGRAMDGMADQFNSFFRGLADATADVDFARLFEAAQPAIDSLLDAFVALARVVEPFLLAAAPAAQLLAEMFEQGANALLGMVEAGAQSGALTDFLEQGVESLGLWLDLVGELAGALFTVFEAGRASGDSFVASLADIIDRWDAWLESIAGQQALQDFFDTGVTVMSSLLPIVESLAEAFGIIVTPDAIGRFDALAASFAQLVVAAAELFAAIGELELLRHVIDGLTLAFGVLADILQIIEPLFDAIPDSLKAGAFGFIAMAAAIGPLTKLFTGLRTAMIGTQAAAAGATTAMGSGGLLGVIAAHPYATLATVVAVSLVGAFNELTAVTSDAEEHIDSLTRGMLQTDSPMESLITHITNLITETPKIATAMKDAGVTVKELAAAALEGGPAFDALVQEIFAVAEGGEVTEDQLQDIISVLVRLPDDANAAVLGFEAVTAATEGVGGAVQGATPWFDVLANNIERTASSQVGAAAAAKTYNEQLLNQAAAGEKAAAAMGDFVSDALTASGALRNARGPIAQLNAEMEVTEKRALAASDAADRLRESFDLLITPSLDAAAAERERIAGLEDLKVALEGGDEAQSKREEAYKVFADTTGDVTEAERVHAQTLLDEADALEASAQAFDIRTEAGRGALEAMENSVKAILTSAEAQTALTDNTAASALAMAGWRQEAIQAAVDAGATEEQVRGLIDTYALTPDEIVTRFVQSGMDDAQKEALQLDEDLNGIPDAIETLISMPGLSQAQIDLLLLDRDMDAIPDVIDTDVSLNADPAIQEAQGLPGAIEGAATGAEVDVGANTEPAFTGIAGVTGGVYGATIYASANTETATTQISEVISTQWGSIEIPVTIKLPSEAEIDPLTGAIFPASETGFEIKVTADASQAIAESDKVGSALAALSATETNALVTLDAAVAVATADSLTDGLNILGTTSVAPSIILPSGPVVKEQVDSLTEGFNVLGTTVAQPAVNLPDHARVTGEIETEQTGLDDLSATEATPSVTLVNYGVVIVQIVALQLALARLDAVQATPSVSLSGYSTVVSQLAVIATQLAGLRDRTVTVTVNTVNTGPGGMTGRMITHPQTMNVGERGNREALIPLDLPLHRIDPSVRAMAALLRGDGGATVRTTGGVSKVVNNTINLTAREADPEAVAAKVINRAAVLAVR